MRGKRAKQVRLEKSAAFRSGRVSSPRWKGGSGKSVLSAIALGELSKPAGLWKEYWTKKIRGDDHTARLPRGFKEPTMLAI